jgi:hypothetical protein
VTLENLFPTDSPVCPGLFINGSQAAWPRHSNSARATSRSTTLVRAQDVDRSTRGEAR